MHAGYEALLHRHADAAEVLLVGDSFAEEFPVLRKEIRALDAEVAARYVAAGHPQFTVRVVQRETLAATLADGVLVVPDEELMRELVARYQLADGRSIVLERTFLRWDREWSQAQRPVAYQGEVSTSELDRRLLGYAVAEAERSSDWWRQVGAVAARDGTVLAVAHNSHRPTEYSPYVNGDPRNDFSRGVRIELSTAIHAEAAIIAHAARQGPTVAGADLYVSTFPCPGCARLVAEAGFRRVYFAGPYAMLDGENVLREAGVELIWVDLS